MLRDLDWPERIGAYYIVAVFVLGVLALIAELVR